MSALNQAIKSTRNLVAKEVDRKLIEIKTREKKESSEWRGKKLISTEKWESWRKKRDFQYKLLDYIPKDFVEHPFNPSRDEDLDKKRDEWYKDYYDFLEYKKNAAYGESKCRSCILHPWHSYSNESLRTIILKGVKGCEFPCRTVNMFECPHGQNKKDSDLMLFTLRDVWKIISDALHHARNLSRSYNKFHDYTYEVDFEKGSVLTYHDRRFSRPMCAGTFSELEDFEISKIPIQSIKDVYDALVNRKSLETILEQYISDPSSRMTNLSTESTIEAESKFLREMKEPIIDYVISLKKKIKIEDLCDFAGRNLEEEKENKKKQEETDKWFVKNEPDFHPDQARSGECVQCGNFSNICCINCDIWVCVGHWRQHAKNIHNQNKL